MGLEHKAKFSPSVVSEVPHPLFSNLTFRWLLIGMILVEALHAVINHPDELQLQPQSNFLDPVSWIPCSDFILWKADNRELVPTLFDVLFKR